VLMSADMVRMCGKLDCINDDWHGGSFCCTYMVGA